MATLLAKPQLNSSTDLGLRTLHVATLLSMNKPEPASKRSVVILEYTLNGQHSLTLFYLFYVNLELIIILIDIQSQGS
jgi:hypothetical protein